ncbi:hypothetical protein [Kitasatospora sp. NPDC094016]|uniref:hypothetical protein n=1 Tax=Kitasatospora sp. NPDC094016 TaxID=3154986 RepID=UPI003332F7C2
MAFEIGIGGNGRDDALQVDRDGAEPASSGGLGCRFTGFWRTGIRHIIDDEQSVDPGEESGSDSLIGEFEHPGAGEARMAVTREGHQCVGRRSV